MSLLLVNDYLKQLSIIKKTSVSHNETVREHVNTYKFADYKKQVIELIGRVTQVSVKTQEITQAMKAVKR